MKVLIVATAVAIASGTAASAGSVSRYHQPLREIPAWSDPSWIPDYNIVPRYRYRPEDDRVDTGPTAKPVVPAEGDYGGTGGSGW